MTIKGASSSLAPGPIVTRAGLGSALAWGLALILLSLCLYGALQSKAYVDGESGGLASSSINFARGGALSHVMWGEHFASAGIKAQTVHPPFFYLLGGIWLSHLGISIETIYGFPVLIALLGMTAASFATWRIFGLWASIVSLLIACALTDFYTGVFGFRPETLVGVLNLAVFAVAMALFFLPRTPAKPWLCMLLGLLVTLNYATHGFSALGIPVLGLATLIAAVRERNFIAYFIAGAAGVAIGLAAWNWLFDGELYRFLFLQAALARSFTDIGHTMWANLLRPALANPLGMVVIVGFGLSHLLVLCRVGAHIAGRQNPSDQAGRVPHALRHVLNARATWLLFWALAFCDTYLGAMALTVGNLGNPYLANLYYLALPAASVGLVKTIELIVRVARAPQAAATAAIAILFLIIVALPGPLFIYAKAATAGGPSSDDLYNQVRAGLARVLPAEATVLMGSSVFPYLYDRPFESTMDLIWRDEIDHSYQPPFAAAVARTVANYAHYRRAVTTLFPPERFGRIAQASGADAMVIGDSCHWWQCKFSDPGAWQGRFVPVGTVVILKDRLGGRPDPMRDADTEIFRVFLRADEVSRLLPDGATRLSTAHRDGFVGVLMPRIGVDGTGLERYTREEWRALPLEQRKRRLGDYLTAIDYFGIAQHRRAAFLEMAHPLVEFAYYEPDISSALSVAQAFEYAMTDPVLWTFLN